MGNPNENGAAKAPKLLWLLPFFSLKFSRGVVGPLDWLGNGVFDFVG